MVVKKRLIREDRRMVVECCFACGALVNRGNRNVVVIMWGDGDPGRDEMVVPWRTTFARLCFRDREALKAAAGLVFRYGPLEVQFVLDTSSEANKTRGDSALPIRATRRYV